MGLTKCCIFILCFAGVLSDCIDISKPGESFCKPNKLFYSAVENKTQPFIGIGSKYYLINTVSKMNWFGAALYCRKYDSDLAVIESEAEMDALSSYLTTNEDRNRNGTRFWLGLTDLAEEGKFMSLKDGYPMPYSKWSEGQPTDYERNEDCVDLWLVNNIFEMNDENCMAEYYAICELRQPKKTCDVCELKIFLERFMQQTNIPYCQN